MDEVGELVRIAHEKHRRVVADQIPVAFLGVELDGKAADVALGIGCTAFAGDGGEPGEQLGLLADLREDLGPRVPGDVVRDGEGTVGARAFGVHAPLGNHLAVEVGQLFQKPDILEQLVAARAGGQHVLIIGHRNSGVGRQLTFVAHLSSPPLVKLQGAAGTEWRLVRLEPALRT